MTDPDRLDTLYDAACDVLANVQKYTVSDAVGAKVQVDAALGIIDRWLQRREADRQFLYSNRKTTEGLERDAYNRVLMVIASGTQDDSTRLAREVLESRTGVTDEILKAPMWKFGTDEALRDG